MQRILRRARQTAGDEFQQESSKYHLTAPFSGIALSGEFANLIFSLLIKPDRQKTLRI